MASGVLWRLFGPRSVAVIGASRDPKKLGHNTLKNLIEGGFNGKIFPINPEAGEVCGIKAYPSVMSIQADIDLAIIAVPSVVVPKVMEECVEKGIKIAVVLSAGFKEVGREGEKLEKEIVGLARAGGIRVLGPNCLGVVNASASMDATLSRVIDPKELKRGPIAFISQSGAFGASLYSWAQGKGIGFDKLISCGNTCDIDESDVLGYLATDVDTKVITMYLEGVRDGRKFLETTRRISMIKPMIVVKIGRTAKGSQAARSHTGALTGLDMAYDAAFKQSGIIRAKNTEEMFDFAIAFATQPLPRGNKMAIVTNAGGPGVAATDACQEIGLELTEVDKQTKERLGRILPRFASTLNPIDTTPQISPRIHGEVLKIVLQHEAVDGVISIIVGSRPIEYAQGVVEAHISVTRKFNKPILLSWTVDKSVENLVRKLEKNGTPVYSTPERAVKVMRALRGYAEFLERGVS